MPQFEMWKGVALTPQSAPSASTGLHLKVSQRARFFSALHTSEHEELRGERRDQFAIRVIDRSRAARRGAGPREERAPQRAAPGAL